MKQILSYILISVFIIFSNSRLAFASNQDHCITDDGMLARKADSIVSFILSKSMAAIFSEELINERNGKIETHIVERGENWKSIARNCRVDESMLKALNPFEHTCLTGMEIRVPKFSISNFVNGPDDHTRARLQEALGKEESGNLKGAIKIYSSIIKNNTSLEARYLRGRAYYRNKKLKQASEDFKYVVENDKDKLFPDAWDIYLQVSDEWNRQKEERRQKWLSIGLEVLDIGMKVTNEYINHKYGSAGTNSFLSGSGYTGLSSTTIAPPSTYLVQAGGMTGTYYNNGVEWPSSLDPTEYFTPDVMKVEVTYDSFGNPMYSSPGIANAIMRMQNDFNMDMSGISSLYSGSATSNAILGQLNMLNHIAVNNADYLASPNYAIVSGTDLNGDDYEEDSSDKNIKKIDFSNNTPKCIYCDNTGWIKKTQSGVATFGQHLPKKKCKICGYIWDPGLEVHSCVECTHCKTRR